MANQTNKLVLLHYVDSMLGGFFPFAREELGSSSICLSIDVVSSFSVLMNVGLFWVTVCDGDEHTALTQDYHFADVVRT